MAVHELYFHLWIPHVYSTEYPVIKCYTVNVHEFHIEWAQTDVKIV